jgi:hypothetical protein
MNSTTHAQIENMFFTESTESLTIVEAMAELEIPQSSFASGRLTELVMSIKKDKDDTDSQLSKIGSLENEKINQSWYKKAAHLVTYNLFGDIDSEIKDEKLRLTQNIAELAKRSVDLLLVNTALSKVVCAQQKTLLEQQFKLEETANLMKSENISIFEKQKIFEETQELSHQSIKDILLEVKASKINSFFQYQIIIVGLIGLTSIVLQFIRH